MSDIEESSKLLDSKSGDNPEQPDLESGQSTLGPTGGKPKLSRSKGKKSLKFSQTSNLFDKLMYYCPSRWIIFVLIGLVVLLYLFTNIQVSFVDQRRWMPKAKHRYLKDSGEQGISQELSQKYDRQFNDRVLTPFKELLARLKGTLGGKTGLVPTSSDISSILPVRVQLNDSQTMSMVEKESNMAASYYDTWKQPGFGRGATKHSTVTYCSNVDMISPHLVRQNNLYWQIVQNTNPDMTVYLYNAYYDGRLYANPGVKLISVTDRQVQVEVKKWWCLLWFDKLADPVLSNITDVYTVWPEYWDFGVKDGIFGPQVITCQIPKEYSSQIPKAISIQTTGDCDKMSKNPGNVLRVIHNTPVPPAPAPQKATLKKPSIGVCVQAFRFGTYDVSVRLVEWLEMVKLLGADKVYFYVYGATESMMKVLRHYEKEGLVDWRRLTLPGEQVNVPSMYNYYYSQLGGKFWPQELIELNDCLYRNIHRHQFVGIFDIDEVIMPQKLNSWHELIARIENGLSDSDRKKKAYYLNRHAYVYEMFEETQLEDKRPIPEYLYTMRHTYRAELLGSGSNIKCLHRTDLVYAVHNHFPMRCLNTTGHHSCDGLVIDQQDSILMHFRRNRSPPEDCKTPETPINCTIHDRNAWRFFDSLATNVQPQLYSIFGDSE